GVSRLTLNGFGVTNNGALLNVSGANVISGNIVLDSSPDSKVGITLGVNSGTTLTVTGLISDLGSGQNLTKEGTGTLTLSRDNTYRGQTNINSGILAIKAPLALGI